MHRLRLAIAIGIVGILGLVAVLAWPRGDDQDGGAVGPVTTTTTTAPTTSTIPASTTTTTEPTTTTLSEEARKAEVEAILQDLWFGWFDAIYRKDPDALWEVVATSAKHAEGVAAMEIADFGEPTPEGVRVEVLEILLDRGDCLVVHDRVSVGGFTTEGSSEAVDVLWPDERYGWRRATSWANPNDLWLGDCDDLVREETP
jgi:Flp pilus assembly protein CpaB